MACDIVVLGGTGFTGQLVVENLAGRPGPTSGDSAAVTWGIAGRSQTKLKQLADKLMKKGLDISKVPTSLVDVNDRESLVRALSSAKVAINCVGPNTQYSEPIVEACLQTRTHYVDISAEINHILSLSVKYQQAAEEANILIVPSCAFASLLAASGYIYLKELFHGTLHTVECYAEVNIPLCSYIPFTGALASAGTWDSLVHVLTHLKEYQHQKTKVYGPSELPRKMQRGFFHWRHRSLWFPYPGPDEDVMEFSERYLLKKRQKKLAHFKLYTKMPLLIHYVIIPAMFLYYYLSAFDWFANLLRRFPRVFTLGYMSHSGPSEKKREQTKYSFTYIGRGWDKSEEVSKTPAKKVKVKLSSNDPYGSSALLVVVAAITILRESSSMPRGGVVNVGAAFYDTKIVDRLRKAGITYEVIPNT